MIVVAGGNAYNLAHEHKNGWNAEAFKERYSEVLDRYDYIVGDWGYNQLRLRGFYEDGNPRATKDTAISSLYDYLNEYCNFGCAYFVLSKTDARPIPQGNEPAEPAPGETDGSPAASGSDAQAAETAAAAASGGGSMLTRWPLKERPGGPVRIPGASAIARAAQEAAEKRQQAQVNARGESRPAGGGNRQGSRPAGGPDKRPAPGGYSGVQLDGRSGGKPQWNPRGGPRVSGVPERQGGGWRQADRPEGGGRSPDYARAPEAGGPRPDGSKPGGRWLGKNKRRNRFGGKPNRPDGPPKGGGGSPNGE